MNVGLEMLGLESVLIANRGEIAVRVARACAELGLRTIAVYSDADRVAPHVAIADEAVHIGGADARSSYLNVDAILDAAIRTGAAAIHPGYGFLSENAEFARACAARNLVFIGPPAAIIERMGSKQQARATAVASGVSVVPGYHGDDQSDCALIEAADAVGYPLMIKASAGGGGRGMRRVHRREDFLPALDLARGEADAAFGNSAVLLERLIGNGRHVEVQILADGRGNVVHLHDRDCSVQRNHQKLIEEAPAPGLPGRVRQAMLGQAVALSQDIGYVNAGTVEFLYDKGSSQYYFLEMNTRLQVEHGVTEAITGIDIVNWQIRIAAGEPLSFGQGEVVCTGHAIEARIAAEDPAASYRPGYGRVVDYSEPEGDCVRVDSGIMKGSWVGHHYDSMLSKVIAKGGNRDMARRRLIRALDRYRLIGPVTNIAFLVDILETTPFRDAAHGTSLIEDLYPGGWKRSGLSGRHIAEVALSSLLARRSVGTGGPWQTLGAWRVSGPAGGVGRSWLDLIEDGRVIPVCISENEGAFTIQVDNESVVAANASWSDGELVYAEAGLRRQAWVCFQGTVAWHHLCPGSPIEVQSAGRALLKPRRKDSSTGSRVWAPMPGMVVEVRVAQGDRVVSGETLVVMEAMKMYQELSSPIDGTVGSVRCAAGEAVAGNVVLIEIEPLAS